MEESLMDRETILQGLKMVMPGVDRKETLLEGSDSFVFDEGWVKKPIISGLHQEEGPSVGTLYEPYDPIESGEFLPLPPEPVE